MVGPGTQHDNPSLGQIGKRIEDEKSDKIYVFCILAGMVGWHSEKEREKKRGGWSLSEK